MRAIERDARINLATGERLDRHVGNGESVFVSRGKLGPQPEVVFGPWPDMPTIEEIVDHVNKLKKGWLGMHYRNGREAKNGDKIVQLNERGEVVAFGVLHSATPGNDYCNGSIAPIQFPNTTACMCDCLHVDDVATLLKEKGLERRPSGK